MEPLCKKFPVVSNFIAKMLLDDEDMFDYFGELEKKLIEKDELLRERRVMNRDVGLINCDLEHLRQAMIIKKQTCDENEKTVEVLFNSLEAFKKLPEYQIKTMFNESIMCKQKEVQGRLESIANEQKMSLQYKIELENRDILKQFRKNRAQLFETQQELQRLDTQMMLISNHWKALINMATNRRNDEIVSLVKLRAQLSITNKLPSVESRPRDDGCSKSVCLKPKTAPVVFKSAVDFIKSLPDNKEVVKIPQLTWDDMETKVVPTKHVTFVDIPLSRCEGYDDEEDSVPVNNSTGNTDEESTDIKDVATGAEIMDVGENSIAVDIPTGPSTMSREDNSVSMSIPSGVEKPSIQSADNKAKKRLEILGVDVLPKLDLSFMNSINAKSNDKPTTSTNFLDTDSMDESNGNSEENNTNTLNYTPFNDDFFMEASNGDDQNNGVGFDL